MFVVMLLDMLVATLALAGAASRLTTHHHHLIQHTRARIATIARNAVFE